MTTQELRELDAWIAEHVMGRTDVYKSNGTPWVYIPNYSTSSRVAMNVLKKCAEYLQGDMSIVVCDGIWTVAWVDWNAEERADAVNAETLELAICLLAKQLFSQTTK